MAIRLNTPFTNINVPGYYGDLKFDRFMRNYRPILTLLGKLNLRTCKPYTRAFWDPATNTEVHR